MVPRAMRAAIISMTAQPTTAEERCGFEYLVIDPRVGRLP
jgi:hypothetical protein